MQEMLQVVIGVGNDLSPRLGLGGLLRHPIYGVLLLSLVGSLALSP